MLKLIINLGSYMTDWHGKDPFSPTVWQGINDAWETITDKRWRIIKWATTWGENTETNWESITTQSWN